MINCYICGEKTTNLNRRILSNRMICCKKCFEIHNGFVCRYCNLVFLQQDYIKNENCCKYCYQGIKSQNNNNKLRFHNYYFKPFPTFYPKRIANQLYFGLQLQIGGVQDYNIVNKFAAYNESNFFYIKKDSTIPIYGCQIVSYPATLEYHLSKKSNWKTILKNAKNSKFKSFNIDDCGLHIHVNRNYFTEQEISKLDFFVNTNNEFLSKISKRCSSYSRYLKKPNDLYGKPLNANRHCALNLCGTETIQFRMFRGTLKYKSVMSYIQLVNCICNYIKKNSDLTNYYKFLEYINNNKTIYLKDFIKQIGKQI